MTIEKRGNSYRITYYIKGERHRITVDHKPTKFEAEELVQKAITGCADVPYNNTVMQLATDYIAVCLKKKKSPATISGYRSMLKNTPVWFLDLSIKNVSVESFQKVIDEYAEKHSPKSTKNLHGFYKCVFADLSHIKNSTIVLPKKEKKAEYEPTTKDIQRILEHIKGSDYECVLNLCAIGLRRGEAMAITSADLDEDNVLTIDKDLVKDDDLKKYIIKDHPKTEASNRRIRIPESIANMIREKEVVYTLYPNSLSRYLHTVQDQLKIPRFRLHILRHYASALLHKKGFTDRQIMTYMGWETAETMHKVYNYNLDPGETQKDISDVFASNIS